MFETIWHSIRKPSGYKQLAQKKFWRLLLTLLAFFGIVTAVHGYVLASAMNPFLTFMEQEFRQKMPPFTYDGTQLQVNAATPLTLSQQNGYQVVVDVTSPFPKDTINKLNSGVVVGKTDLYIIDRGVPQSFSYRQLMLPPLTKDDVVTGIPLLRPLFYVGLVIWAFFMVFWSFLQITLFSFVAMLAGSLRRVRLHYRDAWLVAAFAFIPASLIGILNLYLQSPYVGLAFWIAVFTYIYHGAGSFRERIDVE
ncbi:DUF1189 domain-containing protein [Effusibacillus lacus]|uniref:DUF1189 domain-containing protein n=1 Tax=Effusibacillus lacus TaxID=1348429 RepID=A0A292YKC0_9BACL|nr:DUF1189 domain-containing protein [Effusibacillus lacus]TCS70842.1 uncharacterized protein DUF1189 [Effusibacillus lacus]GAX89361.1 hypothetical protein EFBL_0979 [Effusibacillus lacus]